MGCSQRDLPDTMDDNDGWREREREREEEKKRELGKSVQLARLPGVELSGEGINGCYVGNAKLF